MLTTGLVMSAQFYHVTIPCVSESPTYTCIDVKTKTLRNQGQWLRT